MELIENLEESSYCSFVDDDNDSFCNGNMEDGDEERTIEHFFDEDTWDEINKNLEDFTGDDLSKLSFSSLDICREFYRMYSKVKGFGIRVRGSTKSRVDGHITSHKFVCSREGHRSQKWMDYDKRKKKPRALTRCGCNAHIKFKLEESSQN